MNAGEPSGQQKPKEKNQIEKNQNAHWLKCLHVLVHTDFFFFLVLYSKFSNAILFDCAFNSIAHRTKKNLKWFYSIVHFNQINIYRHSLFTTHKQTHTKIQNSWYVVCIIFNCVYYKIVWQNVAREIIIIICPMCRLCSPKISYIRVYVRTILYDSIACLYATYRVHSRTASTQRNQNSVPNTISSLHIYIVV